MKPVRILADTGLNDSVRNIFVPLKKSVMRPDYPSGPENFPIFPKNNFIIKALPLLTPIIVCQRGPRDRREQNRRTKKGAGHPPTPAGNAARRQKIPARDNKPGIFPPDAGKNDPEDRSCIQASRKKTGPQSRPGKKSAHSLSEHHHTTKE